MAKRIILLDKVMKVSVIVPVYNTENFLARCLESLINQTLQDIEIICVNDGSTDNSAKILEDFAQKDERIQIINQVNQGLSEARNNGIKIAQGEFIGFVDSDDWVSLDFFEKLYKTAIKYNAEIACTEAKRTDGKKCRSFLNVKNEQVCTKTKDKYKACKFPRYCYVWNKIYKRDALLKADYPFPKGFNFEDMLWSHVIVDKLDTLVTVSGAYYFYFFNPHSITGVFNEKTEADAKYAYNKCFEYAYKKGIKVDCRQYTPPKRARFDILGLKIIDIKIWQFLIVLYLFGIPVCRIRLDK